MGDMQPPTSSPRAFPRLPRTIAMPPADRLALVVRELGERRAHEKMAPKGSGNSGDDEKDKKTAASGYAQMYVPTLCDLVATAEFNTIAVEIDAGIEGVEMRAAMRDGTFNLP